MSIAVGTVLGASTLPFSEQHGEHTGNIALGAAHGAVVGADIPPVNSFGVGNSAGARFVPADEKSKTFSVNAGRIESGHPPLPTRPELRLVGGYPSAHRSASIHLPRVSLHQ